MIKKTLYFGSPAYLSLKNEQMEIRQPDVEKCKNLDDRFKAETRKSISIEDVGIVILDNTQITITQGLMTALLENNIAVITCDDSKMPIGLLLPLSSNTIQEERYATQIEASLPLKKQLWMQTIQYKIKNQAAVLNKKTGDPCTNMMAWANQVKSGDIENKEAQAAVYYWGHLFTEYPNFIRDRNGDMPNTLLNYGYAILRAIVARALTASGLLPTLGIHHHNRYNAYCLADDIMEPYRPYVDTIVIEILNQTEKSEIITKEQKIKLLEIPITDVKIEGKRSPLAVAVAQTTASLYKCYSGESRKISYPEI